MIEVIAAIAGASISVAAMGAMGFGKRNDEARDAVIRLTSAVEPGGILIWSAAQPGQGGAGHINCRPKDYWAEQLQAAGLERDKETEQALLAHIESGYHMGWFRQNAMVFWR